MNKSSIIQCSLGSYQFQVAIIWTPSSVYRVTSQILHMISVIPRVLTTFDGAIRLIHCMLQITVSHAKGESVRTKLVFRISCHIGGGKILYICEATWC